MIATNVNYKYWGTVATVKIWEAVFIMHGYDPRARGQGYVPLNSSGDAMDLADDLRLVESAVLAKEIEVAARTDGSVGPDTHLTRDSLAAWANFHGYSFMAAGLGYVNKQSGRQTSSSGSAAPAPRFPKKRSVMVSQNLRNWPTIESDMREASRNGLHEARVGSRGWDEEVALNWARSQGKLKHEPDAPGSQSSPWPGSATRHRTGR
jgi:hypothetical protein